MKRFSVIFLFCFVFLIFSNDTFANDTIYWNKKETTDAFKAWTITFNDTIDQKTVTNENVILGGRFTDQVFETTIRVGENKKTIIVEAPSKGYAPGEYGITIQNIASTSGKVITPTIFQFSVKQEILNENISTIDTVVSLPKTWSISKNGFVTTEDVEWDKESIKNSVGLENTAEITGTIKGTNAMITKRFLFDELYINSLVEGLTFGVSSNNSNREGYEESKFLQFLFDSLLKSKDTSKILKPS